MFFFFCCCYWTIMRNIGFVFPKPLSHLKKNLKIDWFRMEFSGFFSFFVLFCVIVLALSWFFLNFFIGFHSAFIVFSPSLSLASSHSIKCVYSISSLRKIYFPLEWETREGEMMFHWNLLSFTPHLLHKNPFFFLPFRYTSKKHCPFFCWKIVWGIYGAWEYEWFASSNQHPCSSNTITIML